MPHPIEILMNFSEDALANHYQLIIPTFPPVSANSIAQLNLRVLSVEIPEQAIDTYEITKRGRKADRPGGISGQALELSFTYRVDKYFQCYTAISQWLAFIKDPITMAMASDSGPAGAGGPSTFRTDLIILGLDTNNIVTSTWSINGFMPTSQSNVAFEEESGDPIIATVSGKFLGIKYPGMI